MFDVDEFDTDEAATWYDQSPTYRALVEAWDGDTMDVKAAAEFIREHGFSTLTIGGKLDWYVRGDLSAECQGVLEVDATDQVSILDMLKGLGY